MIDMKYSTEYPVVSVVSCFYNRQNYIHESVESLLNQTYKNLEVVLVDDGSTDNTFDLLSSYEDPRIKLISHPNKGFVRALRDAISVSKGEIIAVHGSGDISLPTRIEQQVDLLINNPDVGVVGCYVRNFSVIQKEWYIFRPNIDEHQLSNLIKRNLFTHGEVMFRRASYEQVGGYREFFQFAQDRDLWLRMAPITRFAVIPEVLYQREALAGSVTRDLSKAKKQAYLSEFAIYCAIVRQEKAYDPLDEEGFEAFQKFQNDPSSRLPIRLRNLAQRFLADGNIDAAYEFILESTSVDPSSIKSRYLLIALSLARKSPIFALVLDNILRYRLKFVHYLRNRLFD